MIEYKWINWVEPLGTGKHGHVECRAPIKDIINYMKNEYQEKFKSHKNYPYKNDEEALEDFIAIHYGWRTYN